MNVAPAIDLRQYHQNEIRREGVAPFCHYPYGRDDRTESLEAIRYTVLTMQDLVEAIQNQWPLDRPMPQDLQDKLLFSVYAIKRVRNGKLRRMAAEVEG